MKKLNWAKKRKEVLTEEEKNYVFTILDELASKFPAGFDVSFPIHQEIQILSFVRNEIDVVVQEVKRIPDKGEFTLAFYQNNTDRENRERNRDR